MAMTESNIGYGTIADLARVAENARFAVALQRSIGAVEWLDAARHRIRTVVGGEQYACGARVLQLDEIRFILDFKRPPEPSRQRVIGVTHIDAKPAKRGMREEEAPEQRVMLGLHCAALAHALHWLCAAATRAMQGEPVSTGLEPPANGAALRGVRIRASDIGNQQASCRQPFFDVREVVGDRGLNVRFREEAQQPQPGMIVVVSGA